MDPPEIIVGLAGDIMEGTSIATAPYAPGTEVTYTCQVGYQLAGIAGTATSVCQGTPTFQWSITGSNLPECRRGKDFDFFPTFSFKIKFIKCLIFT